MGSFANTIIPGERHFVASFGPRSVRQLEYLGLTAPLRCRSHPLPWGRTVDLALVAIGERRRQSAQREGRWGAGWLVGRVRSRARDRGTSPESTYRPHLTTVFPEHHDGVSRLDIEHVEICKSARERAVGGVDIVRVDGHDVVTGGQDDGRVLYLGSDRAGNLLEVLTALRGDGTEIVTRAMRVHRSYESLLSDPGEPDTWQSLLRPANHRRQAHRRGARADGPGGRSRARRHHVAVPPRPARHRVGPGGHSCLRPDPELRRARDERAATGPTNASDAVRQASRQYPQAS